MTNNKSWTHKVVKKQRDGQGQWFCYPAAHTGSLADCQAYAAEFAAQQSAAGVVGTRIVVVARKGGAVVADHAVPARA